MDNRYGEDAAVALRDPNWHCPVCRGICNCSFCRAKVGKRPTGILTPLAHQAGHKSVKDFLESLKGEGDYAHQDNLWHNIQGPDQLLGFSSDLCVAHMSGDIQHEFKVTLNLETLTNICQKKQNELMLLKENYDQPHDLLGFFKDSDVALMDSGVHYDLKPSLPKEFVDKLYLNLNKESNLHIPPENDINTEI
ncbi:hypothetical protein NQ314_014249 [Rhamnusium bicolor]|uniref:Zinc-finger domain-containing protein n=1 Tax=Rhamnusium bicolor TaxID=1586634 RepID=A0AAV8X4Y3_9CUCU|nr:hypothetical protein NQ314_014249 [Rhamnusium bicolor]